MKITVIGAGVVGSATGQGFTAHGHEVRFVDASPARVTELLGEGLNASLPENVDHAAADISMISVNTPTVARKVDISNLLAAVRRIGEGLRGDDRPHLVVVRSTVPPTTTMCVVRKLLEATSGRTVGDRLGLAMNPEFLRQRNASGDFLNPWLTVFGAIGPRETELLRELYEPFGAPIVATDPTTAEVIKYAHNLYNATKISFFNEFHLVCDRLGIASDPVGEAVARSAEGMWRPEYGIRGGRPYDGACLPKDAVGFLSFAHELGMDMPLLAATIRVNDAMEEMVRYDVEPDSPSPVIAFPSAAQAEPAYEVGRLMAQSK